MVGGSSITPVGADEPLNSMLKNMSRYVTIPDLDARMIAVDATNISLADADGVAVSCVSRLRSGKGGVEKTTAQYIETALSTCKFTLAKRGRKKQ